MSHLIYPDYDQPFLLPPCIEDWVPADAPVRFVREFVDELDLKELGFQYPQNTEGRPMYAPEMLLKVYLYCYMDRIRSMRKIEQACYKDINLVWLTGNHQPDHNTLWRFWRDNKKVIGSIFKSTVKVALDADLVGFALHAVDGTKIRAACTEEGALREKKLEKLEEKLDKEIEGIERDIEKSEREDGHEYRMPEKLQDRKALREEVRKGLRKLEKAETKNLQPSEPDARTMKTRNGMRFSYNAQAVADETAGVIVAEDVVTDENDCAALVPMIDEVGKNLGKVAQTTVADKGYHAGDQLQRAEDRGYSVLVNERKESPPKDKDERFLKKNFKFIEERDAYICPMGEELTFVRTEIRGKTERTVREYRCRSCRDCPMREECTKDPKGRSIKESDPQGAKIRNHARLQNEVNKVKLKKRKEIIELVFARIKWLDGFVRWTVRGLENVQAQWSLVCAVHNLKRILANRLEKWPKKVAIAVEIIPKTNYCMASSYFISIGA